LNPLYAIIGPTASGKESAALILSAAHGFEILSLDSMKVFRGMDVGTAKASAAARSLVPHHLLDLAAPAQSFCTRDWLRAAEIALIGISSRDHGALFSGGTPLYLQALLYGLFEGPAAEPAIRRRLKAIPNPELHDRLAKVDPESAALIHVNDLRRLVRALEIHEITGVPPSTLRRQWEAAAPRRPCRIAGIRRDRADLYARINERVDRMLAGGLVEEVEALLSAPGGLGFVARQALGYKEVADFLEGAIPTLAEAADLLRRRTRHFARRQISWFKRFDVAWVDAAPDAPAEFIAEAVARALLLESR
jgi:tRNA dimethylallyltransferase